MRIILCLISLLVISNAHAQSWDDDQAANAQFHAQQGQLQRQQMRAEQQGQQYDYSAAYATQQQLQYQMDQQRAVQQMLINQRHADAFDYMNR